MTRLSIADLAELQLYYKLTLAFLDTPREAGSPWVKVEARSGYAPDFATEIFTCRGWRNAIREVKEWIRKQEQAEIAIGGNGGGPIQEK